MGMLVPDYGETHPNDDQALLCSYDRAMERRRKFLEWRRNATPRQLAAYVQRRCDARFHKPTRAEMMRI